MPEYFTVERVFIRIAQTNGECELLEIHCHRSIVVGSKLEVDSGDLRCYEINRR